MNVSPWASLGLVVKQPSSREAQVCNGACRKCKTLLLIRFITYWNMSKTVEQVWSWPPRFGKDSNIPMKDKRLYAVAGLPGSNISPCLRCSDWFTSLLELLEVWEAELFCFCLLLFFLALLLPLSLSLPLFLTSSLKKDETNFSVSAGHKLLLIIPRFLKRASFFSALPLPQRSLNGYAELGGKCQRGFDNDSQYSSLHCYLVKRGAALLQLCRY